MPREDEKIDEAGNLRPLPGAGAYPQDRLIFGP